MTDQEKARQYAALAEEQAETINPRKRHGNDSSNQANVVTAYATLAIAFATLAQGAPA